MNRWGIAVVAVVGLGLALLLFRPISTDIPAQAALPPKSAPEVAPAPAPAPEVAPAAPPAPAPVAAPGSAPAPAPEAAATPKKPKSVKEQLADPSTPRDVRAAATVSGEWSELARRLQYNPQPGGDGAALGLEAAAVLAELRLFRADQTTSDWPTLLTHQRDLMERIRAFGPDASATKALDAIDKELAAQ